ncbi:MAG: TetM/TetW/TetO/TetS family tetracycline resistance ribosomal protection protein [Lachnospiraceae bacterium]|nr:TetM/TetW/TetO/TetS family tetracycline resistance ribosomal protection protein [Lachnospiraceae bacterium]
MAESSAQENNTGTEPSCHLTVGILAHVDAGKTTLSEAILYSTGAIRTIGRVDHGDAYLDTSEVEKARGITVFSRPAHFPLQDLTVTLLDTPGHADFSPEMERTLSVLDYAVLLVAAPEGVGNRARLLWRLLEHYRVPAFLFINKMDQPGCDRETLLSQVKECLTDTAVDFTDGTDIQKVQEEIALTDDLLLESILSGGTAQDSEIAQLIAERRLFPVYFGSALRLQGVEEMLAGMKRFMRPKSYPREFGARVYKITREGGKERFAWMKITGGSLSLRDRVDDSDDKVTGIRIYSGAKFEQVTQAGAGQICAVQGISDTFAGKGLGTEKDGSEELITPVIRRKVILPEGTDVSYAYRQLRTLEEEEPMLRLSYSEETREIFAQIMGEVQIEILRGLIRDRLGLSAEFGEGEIIYRETVRHTVTGAGHFEPLRHYAEVHVAISPGEPGSGITVDTDCSTDVLATNWQRLAVSCLLGKRHKGVLTGSDLTDVRITLIGGRAHEKHTEGGDFRKASIRAVRQALMCAENILLEPVYEFCMRLPQSALGMAMTDVERMNGRLNPPLLDDGQAVLTGTVPVSAWGDYALRLRAATGGEGSVTVTPAGYEPCHHAAQVIKDRGYDPSADLKNPVSSVFCSHGAGVIVPWYEAKDRMHVETDFCPDPGETVPYPDAEVFTFSPGGMEETAPPPAPAQVAERERAYQSSEDELMAIFEKTYGKIRRPGEEQEEAPRRRDYEPAAPKARAAKKPPEGSYLLIDGYNMLYAEPSLRALAVGNLSAARDALIDAVANVQGYARETMILVFDAYRVAGGKERVFSHHGLTVIYTKEAETADQYIEKAACEIGKKYRVRVATSDAIEQVIIFGSGAVRLSASAFWEEMRLLEGEIRDHTAVY